MSILDLPIKSFSGLKVISGICLLVLSLYFPLVALVSLAVLAIGKAHSVGAWLSMWRAGKLNYIFLSWIVLITTSVSYWGIKMTHFDTLWAISTILFAFHFMFDEMELQEVKDKNYKELLRGVIPFVLICIYVFFEYYKLPIPTKEIIIFAGVFTVLELLFVSKINWYFIQTKVLTAYVLTAMVLEQKIHYIMAIFLLYHYVYWFIYPVYKLNKYKKEERDGLIAILVAITLSSIFVYSTRVWGVQDVSDELALRSFAIASMVHVLTTAPFAYLMGYPKPSYILNKANEARVQ